MTDAATKTLEAKCLCGAVHFTLDMPVSLLPLQVRLCHCSICRYTSGAPCVFHMTLPKGMERRFVTPSVPSNITLGPAKSGLCTIDFCSTCGCHVGSTDAETGELAMSTSIFSDHGPDVFQINRHIFSKSVKDCGIAPMVMNVGGRVLADRNPPDDHPRAEIVSGEIETGKDGEERLRAECYCGGVSFTIPRPTKKVMENPFMSQYVSPEDNTKWLAAFDLCDDCRLSDGTHVVGWAFIPLSLCEPPITSDLKIGTAKNYASSPGVLRSFCGTCGATVFYHHDDRKPSDETHVVDLATGILRAPEGGMAENWLHWRARAAWTASGQRFDKEFTDALEEGMRKWSMEKYGKVLDMSIP